MPMIHGLAVLTPFGDAEASLAALTAAQGQPGRLGDCPLDQVLVKLGRTACGGLNPERVLLATTKAELGLWCASLTAEAPSLDGGPAWLAGRLADAFGCPCHGVSAACASGSAAVGVAGRAILGGTCRRVLVLAGDRLGPFVEEGFAHLKALDPSGRCRPFDRDRAGLCLGETAAAMLLCAEDEGGLGVQLSGWGASMDANHLTGPSRDGGGLEAACRQALDRAGMAIPDAVIAHGTGTRYNDDSESLAYARLCPGAPVVGWKGLLGHSLGSCGLSELALATLVVARGLPLPGTVNLGHAGTAGAIGVLGPGGHAGAWRRLLTANAGFGGLNAAIIIGGGLPRPLRSVQPRLAAQVHFHEQGWELERDGIHNSAAWDEPGGSGTWPRLTARVVLGTADASWGRMDDACRALVALCHRLGPCPAATALVLLTENGCAATDRRFEQGRRRGECDPQLFPYTLASAPVGEASIRCGLKGPGLVVQNADDTVGQAMVADLLAEGWQQALLARVECDTRPWTAWAQLWAATP